MQGGFLTAMLDDTVGPAATAALPAGQFTQTLEIKTSFLRPARVGPIFAEARVVHRGRDILFVEGFLSEGEGRILATATATMRIISLERK